MRSLDAAAWLRFQGIEKAKSFPAASSAGPPTLTPRAPLLKKIKHSSALIFVLPFQLRSVFMPKAKIQFLQKPTCTTCRKAKAYLEKLGAELESRSLDKQKLNRKGTGRNDRRARLQAVPEFPQRALSQAQNRKIIRRTRAQAIALMAENPTYSPAAGDSWASPRSSATTSRPTKRS